MTIAATTGGGKSPGKTSVLIGGPEWLAWTPEKRNQVRHRINAEWAPKPTDRPLIEFKSRPDGRILLNRYQAIGAEVRWIPPENSEAEADEPAPEKPKASEEWRDDEPGKNDANPKGFDIPPHDFWGAQATEHIRPGMLPQIIENVGFEYAERNGFDRDTLVMTMLTMASSVIATGIKVADSHAEDSRFLEAIRIWLANVGVAGSGKSPIMEAVEPPFDQIDEKLSQESAGALADYMKLTPDERRITDKPKDEMLILADISTEAGQVAFNDNPNGMLGKFDELITFFATKSRYGSKGNGGGEQSARGFWLSAYDSKRFKSRRLNRANVDCFPSISIVGGLQPVVLKQLMEEASQNDGLVQRFTPNIMPDSSPPKIGDDKPAKYPMNLYWDLVKNIFYHCPLRMTGATLHFAPKANVVKEQFYRWVSEQVEYYRPIDDALASHINKYRGMFLRFCGLFHVIENWADKHPRQISYETAMKVYRLMTGPRLAHAVAFYSMIKENEETADMKGIAEFILRNRLEIVSAREIQQGAGRYRDISTRDIAHTVGNMISLGWLYPIVGKRIDTFNWKVSPDVHLKFRDRALIVREKHAERKAISDRIISLGGRRKSDAT